jgi:hypothetical protein
MKDYVQRLIARLTEAERPLSRNRHFHTFANPHGRRALRASRELRSLAQDILEQAKRGEPIRVEPVVEGGNVVRVLLEYIRLKARRTAFLSPGEFEILLEAEGVREALQIARSS